MSGREVKRVPISDAEYCWAYLVLWIVVVVTAMSFGASFWQGMGLAFVAAFLAPEGTKEVK